VAECSEERNKEDFFAGKTPFYDFKTCILSIKSAYTFLLKGR
jgi:hypothetical protein